MASGVPLPTQFGEPLANGLSIGKDPSIWGIVALIPLSLYTCSEPHVGMGLVLITRLAVILTMNFVQKEAVMFFPCWFLLAYQMLLQIVLIGTFNYRAMKWGKWSDLGWWSLYMTPCWILQLVTSLYAFKETSVSTIQIIRSMLPLMSFAMEKALYDNPKTVSGALLGSMVLVIVGTTLYGYSSASATWSALTWIFANSVFTVVATVLRSRFMKDESFTVSLPAAMCSVSTTAVPCIFLAALLTGETLQWPDVLTSTPPTAWFFATISGLIAGCFTFLQFRCQKVISGTSDLMFQNFVKVFIIVMGIMAFGDSFDAESLTGCIVALGGCALYGRLRLGKEVSGGQGLPTLLKSDLKAPLMSGRTADVHPAAGSDPEANPHKSERHDRVA